MDSVYVLPKVEVKSESLRGHSGGERIESWDSLSLSKYSNGHIGDVLEEQSGVFVKNFGPGSLSTLSTRGSSAGHTAVTWNGLPIQSPMLGLLDVSLLPTDLIDNAQLRLGGNSSLWGSGAIGGVLALENHPILSRPLTIQLGSTVGSFGRFDHSLKLENGNQKWGLSTTLLRQHADNDFSFRLSNGDEKKLSNASRTQHAILQEIEWEINANQKLSLHLWWQNTKREIPPTAVQNRSEAAQDDDVIRLALHWKKKGKSSFWTARMGYFTEEIDYRDPLILLKAISHFWSIIGDVEGRYQLSESQVLTLGFTQIVTRAFADEYDSPPTESRSSVFSSFQQKLGKTNLQLSARQSLVDGNLIGFSPSFSFKSQISEHLSVQGKVSRNYRLPTLNDRFWRPGGNEDLRAENGWSQEMGVTSVLGKLHYQITAFNRNIEDWILWSPAEGANYWSAKNLTKVWSRGIEQRLNYQFDLGRLKCHFTSGYDFILSTNEVALEAPKIGAGEQLIYVPKHQAFGGIQFQFKKMEFSYRHRLVSKFEAPNGSLDGHHLGYFRTAYFFNKKVFSGNLNLRIENIWDADYRVVERRPMPGRYFSLSLKVNFHKTKKEHK